MTRSSTLCTYILVGFTALLLNSNFLLAKKNIHLKKKSPAMIFFKKLMGPMTEVRLRSLRAGKTLAIKAKGDFSVKELGFSAKKGNRLLVSMKSGGFLIRKKVGKKVSKGLVVGNNPSGKALLVRAANKRSPMKANMRFTAKGGIKFDVPLAGRQGGKKFDVPLAGRQGGKKFDVPLAGANRPQ